MSQSPKHLDFSKHLAVLLIKGKICFRVFTDFSNLSTFFIPRTSLPVLPKEVIEYGHMRVPLVARIAPVQSMFSGSYPVSGVPNRASWSSRMAAACPEFPPEPMCLGSVKASTVKLQPFSEECTLEKGHQDDTFEASTKAESIEVDAL
jgi:hypothetical protein